MTMPIHEVFFLLILLLANSFKLSYSIILCPEIEKEALISFKQSLANPSNILMSSWNGSNCCNWKGVVCSNLTGNVHQLHLRGDWWNSDSNSILLGKINPSLLKLKHLKYLDLSQNDFEETIPSFIGSLSNLEYLNLSSSGLHGKIPPTIGNLSRLHTLSLENNGNLPYIDVTRYVTELDVDGLEWLRGLSQLEHLSMNEVDLSKESGHWMQQHFQAYAQEGSPGHIIERSIPTPCPENCKRTLEMYSSFPIA